MLRKVYEGNAVGGHERCLLCIGNIILLAGTAPF